MGREVRLTEPKGKFMGPLSRKLTDGGRKCKGADWTEDISGKKKGRGTFSEAGDV